jgi:hypothetical protein
MKTINSSDLSARSRREGSTSGVRTGVRSSAKRRINRAERREVNSELRMVRFLELEATGPRRASRRARRVSVDIPVFDTNGKFLYHAKGKRRVI